MRRPSIRSWWSPNWRIVDRQIGDTIRQYAQVSAMVGHTDRSGDLRRFIESGKKIIISTVQRFPFILDEIGNEQRGRSFAIIINEARSSQGGRSSAAMAQALTAAGEADEEETYGTRPTGWVESRKLLPNSQLLRVYRHAQEQDAGDPRYTGSAAGRDGVASRVHSYTAKQAIQEGFILDVLARYAPVASYYRLAKTVEDGPEVRRPQAQRRLRRFVAGATTRSGSRQRSWSTTSHDRILAQNKVGGAARAMVVTNGVERAIQYYHAISDYLAECKSRFQALVAFSGEEARRVRARLSQRRRYCPRRIRGLLSGDDLG